MSAFLIDVEVPDHEPAVKKSLAKLELLKSQMKNSQLIVDIAEEEIRSNIHKLRDSLFLSRQSHEVDLIWILGELKAIITSWPNDGVSATTDPMDFSASVSDVRVAVIKDRVQHLATALDEKVKESR